MTAGGDGEGLVIKALKARVTGAGVHGDILRGIDIHVRAGEVHAVMGPNGSGKSTLSNVLLGHPGYVVTGGTVTLDGADVLAMETWERAQAGLFLAMQYPIEVAGVTIEAMLSDSLAAGGRDPSGVARQLEAEAGRVGFDLGFLHRALNVDLSGGERKRSEVVQLAALQPRFAILDEIDSGLDVDALRAVARRISAVAKEGSAGVLAITHYSRLLNELRPDRVHVLSGGRIVQSGGPELAGELERTGYAAWADKDDTEAPGATSA